MTTAGHVHRRVFFRPAALGLHAPFRRAFLAGSALLAMAIGAGCTQLADPSLPQTTVFPASDWNHQIVDLYVILFWMALFVFVGVEGFMVYTLVRYRRRADNAIPSQTHGNTRLEVAWTILPSIVLLVIAVPSIGTIFASDAPPATSTNPVKVRVVGHQWWWEYQYPDLGVTTANELHLPLGRTAVFDIESIDVNHAFWFPKMGGKVDAIPTRTNHMWFTPQQTGVFLGQCTEYCGTQHANMRARLIVDTPADFDAWVERQRAPANTPQVGVALRGYSVFAGSACPACHTIRGTASQGKVAPDLTHVGSRTTIAAGVLDATPENVARWVTHNEDIKVNNKMHNQPMSDADAAAVAVYLLGLQ